MANSGNQRQPLGAAPLAGLLRLLFGFGRLAIFFVFWLFNKGRRRMHNVINGFASIRSQRALRILLEKLLEGGLSGGIIVKVVLINLGDAKSALHPMRT